MLTAKCDGLQEAANILDEIGISVGHDTTASAFIAHDISDRMRDAADTIESLRDSLNKVADKWAEAQIKAEDYARENMLLKRDNDTRWHELFGTPERAARTIADACTTDPGDGCIGCPAFGAKCGCGGYDALLEWLKGVDS
jgi:hypothetical protein